MEFKIEKFTKRVAKGFVVVNGVWIDSDEFDRTVEQLEVLAGEAIERRDLNRSLGPDWAIEWEKRGVVRTFQSMREDDYGNRLHFEMIGKGREYGKFMRELARFVIEMRAQEALSTKKARRSQIKAQLKALDEPTLID